jgi:hypothetical protein
MRSHRSVLVVIVASIAGIATSLFGLPKALRAGPTSPTPLAEATALRIFRDRQHAAVGDSVPADSWDYV